MTIMCRIMIALILSLPAGEVTLAQTAPSHSPQEPVEAIHLEEEQVIGEVILQGTEISGAVDLPGMEEVPWADPERIAEDQQEPTRSFLNELLAPVGEEPDVLLPVPAITHK